MSRLRRFFPTLKAGGKSSFSALNFLELLISAGIAVALGIALIFTAIGLSIDLYKEGRYVPAIVVLVTELVLVAVTVYSFAAKRHRVNALIISAMIIIGIGFFGRALLLPEQ